MTEHREIDVLGAERRIGALVLQTPLVEWEEQGIWLKCENDQLTGSFKLRGALNKVLSLNRQDLARGLVAASAGNHGIGVALAGLLCRTSVTVVVPHNVVPRKRQALESLGAEVILSHGDFAAAEQEGLILADRRSAVWVSPYNDPQVVAGQGTLGLELGRQLRRLGLADGVEVYVPVSGGGLLSGVGLGLRLEGFKARLVGAQPEHVPYFHRFLRGDDPAKVVESPTLADGLAGAVETGSITWELVRRLADDVELVSEADITSSLAAIRRATGMWVEPAAAVAAAACRRGHGAVRVAILSGGNVDPSLMATIE